MSNHQFSQSQSQLNSFLYSNSKQINFPPLFDSQQQEVDIFKNQEEQAPGQTQQKRKVSTRIPDDLIDPPPKENNQQKQNDDNYQELFEKQMIEIEQRKIKVNINNTSKYQEELIQNHTIYEEVFKQSHQKKDQKSNKNFIKFLIPKFLQKIECHFEGNEQLQNFIQQIKNGNYNTIKRLYDLFYGYDQFEFKKQNRKLLHQMLLDQKFIKKHIYDSNYIKTQKNRKQYLLAVKIFRLRCYSSQLIIRVQTK